MKPWLKNILSALVIAVAGFALFNAAFIFAFLVTKAMELLFRTDSINLVSRIVYIVIILLISWFVLRSRLPDLFKAAYLTMPLMVVLILLGILLYGQPSWLIYGIGAVIVGGVVFFLYKKKLSWMYYFSVAYVTVLALIVLLTGIDI